MFTGIITDIGEVNAIIRDSQGEWGDTRMDISCAYDPDTIDIGASIALSGACMTVIEKTKTDAGCIFAVEVSDESLSKTHLGQWDKGRKINLERAMKVGDEYGGHMVSGHVDGIGEVLSISAVAGSHNIRFSMPADLRFAIAPKGSITIDGVSLTVNAVGGDWFEVNIIPHTWEVTTLGQLQSNDKVNLEIDTIARYVARYLAHMKETM
ncbi:riboflavin synthase [Robiginitomaculum antarcticum]|uniref:riboflavin synthase n=1 Tax=Robiginitomaculum antarcticum TaxID=437507 RepID=UPI00035FDDF0|nr:riboflavin synthase [Robiginitomaculum antarcticum]